MHLFLLIEESDTPGSYQVVEVNGKRVDVIYDIDSEVEIVSLPDGKVRVLDAYDNVATESDPRTWPQNHAGVPTFEVMEGAGVMAFVSFYATREEVLQAAGLTEDDLDVDDDADWDDEDEDDSDVDDFDDLDDEDEDDLDEDWEDEDWEDEEDEMIGGPEDMSPDADDDDLIN